jgi:hypothetical protein
VTPQSRIDTSDIPTFIVGRDLRVSYANPAAHQALGRAQGTLSGVRFRELLANELEPELDGLQLALLEAGAYAGRAAVRSPQGQLVILNLMFESTAQGAAEPVAVSVSFTGEASDASGADVALDWSDRASGTRPAGYGLPPSQTISELAPPKNVEAVKVSAKELLAKDLQMLANLLRWADHTLATPIDANTDVEAMRARARFVIEEASDLLTRCRDELGDAQV